MIELIILIGLLLYIGYLHYRLMKHKIQDTSSNPKSYVSPNYRPVEFSPFTRSKEIIEVRDDFYNSEMLRFIFGRTATKVFIHYTRNEIDAGRILSEGFQFVTSFYKTAEEVRNDRTDLIYKHNQLKPFGNYVIVIAIDRTLYEHFLRQTSRLEAYEVFVEQILTEKPPYLNEDSDMVYTLHHRFVKGYFNYQTGMIVKNPDFKPSYHSGIFEENLRKLSV